MRTFDLQDVSFPVIFVLYLQIAGFNGLSDALKRLDFLSAVHDCRRFNYIVRLLDLLVSHRMGGLSGCAQRVLFNMLEEVALEGIELNTKIDDHFILLLIAINMCGKV